MWSPAQTGCRFSYICRISSRFSLFHRSRSASQTRERPGRQQVAHRMHVIISSAILESTLKHKPKNFNSLMTKGGNYHCRLCNHESRFLSAVKILSYYSSSAPVKTAFEVFMTALSPWVIYSHFPKNFWNSAPRKNWPERTRPV